MTDSSKFSLCYYNVLFQSHHIFAHLKPIFHQNTKYLASGVGVGHCTRHQNFELPNTKYTNMLVYFAIADAIFLCSRRQTPDAKPKICVSPDANPDASQWNIGGVGSQRKILALAMYIFFFLCRFHSRWVANANPISSGIWALRPCAKYKFPRKCLRIQ